MKFYDYVRRIVDTLVAVIFGLVCIVVFLQVIMRYVFNNSLTWADETSRFLFVWLIYLGGTITIRNGKMISFDLLIEACSGKTWKIMHLLVTCVCIIFLGFAVIWGTKSLMITNGELSPVMKLPMVFIKGVIPFGCILMIIEQIIYCVVHWHDKDTKEEVSES